MELISIYCITCASCDRLTPVGRELVAAIPPFVQRYPYTNISSMTFSVESGSLIPSRMARRNTACVDLISNFEDLHQSLVQDIDIVVDQHPLICRTALAHHADERKEPTLLSASI